MTALKAGFNETVHGNKTKYTVIDPRPGKGIVGTFDRSDVDKAIEAKDAIDAELAADAENRAAKSAFNIGPHIEILTIDSQPIDGIVTQAATDREVYTQKPSRSNKLTSDKVTTEKMLVQEKTGIVLVGRDHGGKVKAAWGNEPDFGRPMPLTYAGLAKLRALLAPVVPEVVTPVVEAPAAK